MHWVTEQYTEVLKSLLTEFVTTKRDGRAAVITDAVNQITAIAEKEKNNIPPFLQKVLAPILCPILYSKKLIPLSES